VGGVRVYIKSSTDALEVALDVDETILKGVEFALTEGWLRNQLPFITADPDQKRD
jgi:hypothetical protein